MDIRSYQHVVKKLRCQHENPELKKIIKTELKRHSSPALVFHLFNEIKRLAKPSQRPFRIDQYFPNTEWQELTHNGLVHHLNRDVFDEFKNIVKAYNDVYTIGVEEHLDDYVKNHKDKIKHNETLSNIDVTPINIEERIYRKEERMNLGIKVDLIDFEGAPEPDKSLKKLTMTSTKSVVTQDISYQGLRVKSTTPKKKGELFLVRFTGFEDDFAFSNPFVLYECVSCEVKNESKEHTQYSLAFKKIDHPDNREFEVFVQQLIKTHRKRYQVSVDNVEKSVINQVCEQFMTNRQEFISVFLDNKKHPAYIFGSALGEKIHQQFDSPTGSFLPSIVKAIKNASKETEFLAIVQQKDGEMFAKTLDDTIDSQLFFQYAIHASGGRLFRIKSNKTDPATAFLSHNLPDLGEANKKLKQVRRLTDYYSQNTRQTIQSLSEVITIAPLDKKVLGALCLPPKALSAKEQKAFSKFATGKRKTTTPYITARGRELRQEDRFKLTTSCTVSTRDKKYQAISIDISESGACLKIKGDTLSLEGQMVTVEFLDLKEIENITPRLKYRVVDDRKGKIRLLAEGASAREYFGLFLDRYFYQLDPIQEKDNNGTDLVGIDRALRNLQNSAIPHYVGITHFKGAFPYPRFVQSPMTEQSRGMDSPQKINTKRTYKNWLCQKRFIEQLKTDYKHVNADNPFERRIVVFAFNQKGKTVFCEVFTPEQISPDKKEKLGTFLRKKGLLVEYYQLDVTRKSRVFNRYFREELSYIENMTPHRAEVIHEIIRHTAGVISLIPLPEIPTK